MLKKMCDNLLNIDGARGNVALTLFLLLFPTVMITSIAHGASTNTLAVSATVISKNVCKFKTATAAMNFGALDPGNSSDITNSTSLIFVCQGSAPLAAFALSTDNGLHSTGPNAYRMQHTTVTTAFLPYNLSLNPTTGTVAKGVDQTVTITGTVSAPNYQPALAGNYSDTVRISLNP